MNTKLTLRLDGALVARAKKYARKEGKSVSGIVADYFRAIGGRNQRVKTEARQLGPITSRLCGVLKGAGIDEKDYRSHQESHPQCA